MIFNEIYSVYYNTVAKIISAVLNGNANEKILNEIVAENAFGESMLTILPSLKSEKWQLITADMKTPIEHIPTMPLTLIQKQWLKAISLDPRVKLFGAELPDFNDVEPLFTPDDYCIYDKYSDGDPFEDEGYINCFRAALSAIKNKNPIKAEVLNRKGSIVRMTVRPQRIEYSEKDDKFRLISIGCRHGRVINMARLVSVQEIINDEGEKVPYSEPERATVAISITDERNALERAMLHFAHFEKQVERLDENHYILNLMYNKEDEFELVIRVLSFGPLIEVVEPPQFRSLIIDRLKSQKSCELF